MKFTQANNNAGDVNNAVTSFYCNCCLKQATLMELELSGWHGRCNACDGAARAAVRWWAEVMLTEKGLPDWRQAPAGVSWLETTLGSGHHYPPAYALLHWALAPPAGVNLRPYVEALKEILPYPPWEGLEPEWAVLCLHFIEWRHRLHLRAREGKP